MEVEKCGLHWDSILRTHRCSWHTECAPSLGFPDRIVGNIIGIGDAENPNSKEQMCPPSHTLHLKQLKILRFEVWKLK